MKLKKTLVIGILLLCILIPKMFSQVPKRNVSFTTFTQSFYAIPDDISIDSLSQMDFNKMIYQDKTQSTSIIINEDYYPTITVINHDTMRYYNDYSNQVAKIVSDKDYTILYDNVSNELFRKDNNGTSFGQIDPNSIQFFGLSNSLFETNVYTLINSFESNGFECVYLDLDKILIATNDSIEITIDYEYFIHETRFFINNEFTHSITKYFQKINDNIIPFYDIYSEISMLTNNVPLLTSKMVTYLEYLIYNEKEDIIVKYEYNDEINPKKNIQIGNYENISKRDIGIKIYPNPSSDIINVVLPFYFIKGCSIEIINNSGISVYKNENVNEMEYQINVSTLQSGLYLIKCYGNGEQVSGKFIKN